MTDDRGDVRGIDLGGGWILAPHRCSDEDEEINYRPVTPENYELKNRAIRAFCLKLSEMDRMVSAAWVSGHIMCILKYGDGFTHLDEAQKGGAE